MHWYIVKYDTIDKTNTSYEMDVISGFAVKILHLIST